MNRFVKKIDTFIIKNQAIIFELYLIIFSIIAFIALFNPILNMGESLKSFVDFCTIISLALSFLTIASVNNQNQNKLGTDEIVKLKELLDMGIVTQEEFDKKKKELLGL